MASLTIAHVRALKAAMSESEIMPARITTYALLRKMRRQAKALGMRHRWRIGDYYFMLWTQGAIYSVTADPPTPR